MHQYSRTIIHHIIVKGISKILLLDKGIMANIIEAIMMKVMINECRQERVKNRRITMINSSTIMMQVNNSSSFIRSKKARSLTKVPMHASLIKNKRTTTMKACIAV